MAVAAVCLLVAVCVTASVRRPTRNLLTTLFVDMAVTSTEGALLGTLISNVNSMAGS